MSVPYTAFSPNSACEQRNRYGRSLAFARAGREGAVFRMPTILNFILDLKSQEFEIALHNVRNHHSKREMIKQGLEEFSKAYGALSTCSDQSFYKSRQHILGSGTFHQAPPFVQSGNGRYRTDMTLKGMLRTHLFSGATCAVKRWIMFATSSSVRSTLIV